MIAKAALLFLFGTTLTSGQFWPRTQLVPYGILHASSRSGGCPSGPELAPLICKFMQQDIGFKPQLIAPTTYIAPLVVEKCDTPKLQMDIELPEPVEEKKPLVIPQPPELPPMMIPKFSVPVIMEEPPAPIQEDDSADIEVMPAVSIPTTPELPLQEEHEVHQLASLPAAPELPAFVMPELPVHIIEQELLQPAMPQVEDEAALAPILAYGEPLAHLPAAPELPAFIMPEFPVRIVEQEAPMPAKPCLSDEPALALNPAYVEQLAHLPAAPELPTFIMPELPVRVIEQELPWPAAPMTDDKPIQESMYVEPLAPLPTAPELPAFVMPDFPIHVEAPVYAIPKEEEEPAQEPAYVEPLAPLPAAPELPKFVMPEIPTQVLEEKSPMPAAPCLNDEPVPAPIPTYVAPLPAAPELPPFEIPEFAVRVAELPMPASQFLPVPTYSQPMEEFNYNMVDYQPMPIPQPPELQRFVMPELPVHVVEHDSHMFAAPCLNEEPSPAHFEPLAPIPAAPELPAAPLPELPMPVEIPSAPMIIEEPSLDEKHMAEIDYNTIEYQPMVPQPPELPTFVMPELPVHIVKQEFPLEPLAPLPAAPELPPVSMLELPVRVEIPVEPELKAAPELTKIPQAPVLPELEIPKLPVKVEIKEPAPCAPTFVMPSPFYQKLFPAQIALYDNKAKEMQNTLLPNQPMNPGAFPMPCVYNLVMQHVLPNMMPHNFRPMENIAVQPAPFVPCS